MTRCALDVQECGIGVCDQSDGCSWLCHAECACEAPGWMPTDWNAGIQAGSLLPAAPDNPGGAISNGYIGAWVPRGLPGSAGSPVCGVEHVKGVFAPVSGALFGYDDESKKVQLASLASWTATAYLASIGSAKLPATASAMDFQRAAYRVASKAGKVECVQNTFAHRSKQNLLVSEFVCKNNGDAAQTITIQQGRCNPLDLVDDYIYDTLCPRRNASRHGYVRQDRPSGMAGVTCTLSIMGAAETPGIAVPTLGECHSEVPEGGLSTTVGGGETVLTSLISARFSNMDHGRHGTAGDQVERAKAAWLEANASAMVLFSSHVAAIEELNIPGIEVEGNLELARVVNSSMYALLGAYRNDSRYSSAPEGLVSTRYSGHAFWDVETWQWPTWLVFWPDQASAALQYRVDLMEQAAENTAHLSVWLHDFTPSSPMDQFKPKRLEGLRFPWESALAGIEQCSPNDENHIVGDIALAFRQYWRATHNVTWLKTSGFPVIEGIARYYSTYGANDAR